MNRGKYAYVGLWVRCALGKKILRLKNPTSAAKKTENNRFRVPIHFATNRFTFGENPPPPPLLHPKLLRLILASSIFALPEFLWKGPQFSPNYIWFAAGSPNQGTNDRAD